MRIVIDRYKTKVTHQPGWSIEYSVGDIIESIPWFVPDYVPRVGDLLTIHPTDDGEPSEDSWTGKVMGVQSVHRRWEPTVVCVTVRDEGVRQ